MIQAASAALWLGLSSAVAADVDRGASGAVVTVRPGPGERLAVVDSRGREVPLPDDAPELWGIAPDAYREAVATVLELQGFPDLVQSLQLTVDACQSDLDTRGAELGACSTEKAELDGQVTTHKRYRWWFLGVGFAAGVGAGIAIAW